MSRRPRREAPEPVRRRSRPKARNQVLFIAAILALALGAFYTALVVATQIDQIFFPGNEIRLGSGFSNLPGIDKGNTEEVGGRRINILVMGLDRRPAEGDSPSRTDTMFVMTVDPGTKTARGLAMPRDLQVPIVNQDGEVLFEERINTAYIYGEQGDYPGGGIGTVEATVENLLGIKLDYYVLIDFEGFKQVIDLLGGIDIEVPEPGVYDPTYSETELLGDFYPCIFEPGIYHMNGSDALCYARVRRNSSDLDRILRQQRVIFAVMDRATELDMLSSVDNAVSLWQRYKDTIVTDINDQQIPGFAQLARSIDQNQLAFLSLGAATTPYTTPAGAQVLLPSPEGIQQIVDAFLSDDRLLTEAAVVEVQNGTPELGYATSAVEYFVSLGIPQSSLVAVNAANNTYEASEIIDFSGKSYTAARLADWLGLPSTSVRTPTEADTGLRNTDADIVVILGADANIGGAVATP